MSSVTVCHVEIVNMSLQQPSMLTKQVIWDGLIYILMGKMRVKDGHLPIKNHVIPQDFIGVCVASNQDAATDDYVILQLHHLGVKQVRLDFSYGDLTSFNTRFLHRLIAENFAVSLHIIQPFDAAKNMESAAEQAIWRKFLVDVLQTFNNAFGEQIKQIEIGTTINRKRWAGYTFDGFLSAWQIAHQLVKPRNIKLAGPNIQDFEPFYNISLLKTLKASNQLPDIVSNNLFSERVTEPERYDHRVFKYAWAVIFKYNLIKKARVLKKISQDFGVSRIISPAAFWALYRIERRLPDAAQKQADYAARYFLLLAASGALEQANWGAFICQREGLIDDGFTEEQYPDLERIAHYKQADGTLKDYQARPSFYAVKTVAAHIQGAQYIKPISTRNELQIHHFILGKQHLHVAWALNGQCAMLSNIYTASAIKTAKILHRDGDVLNINSDLISESPLYLIWDDESAIELVTKPNFKHAANIHAHIKGHKYFKFEQAGWQGLILAKDASESQLIAAALHPDTLQSPNKDEALRHARNAIWAVPDPRDDTHQLTVKQPIKMYPHKAFLDRFKPSKAKRSWNGTMQLMRRGIDTAPPIAYFEKLGDNTLKQNFYICEYVPSDCNIGQIFSAFANGETSYLELNSEEIFQQFAQFCHHMHGSLIYFRDFSGGNILVNVLPNNQLKFTLIDTARLHCLPHTPFPLKLRIADLTRACHKLDWKNRERFMQIYLGLLGRQFTLQYKLQFYLYDAKVCLKRRIGRKGIKKLLKKFKRN
jgi:hypothetical protein